LSGIGEGVTMDSENDSGNVPFWFHEKVWGVLALFFRGVK
jgi:uncharacterized membrane protein